MIEKENKYFFYFDKNFKMFLIRYFLDINIFDIYIYDKYIKVLVILLLEFIIGSCLGEEIIFCFLVMIKFFVVIFNFIVLE